jgi:hypothetical protein
MGIRMELWTSNHPTEGVGPLQLCGSDKLPGSRFALKSGEWIEVQGKARTMWKIHNLTPCSRNLENRGYNFRCVLLNSSIQSFWPSSDQKVLRRRGTARDPPV